MSAFKHYLVASAMVYAAVVSNAHAVPLVIDFEDSGGEAGPGTTMLTSQGIVFDWSVLSPSVPIVVSNNFAGGGGNELLFCGWCEASNGTSIYAADGSEFSLTSFLFGSNDGPSGVAYAGTVTGYLDGGGMLTQSFSVPLGTSGLVAFDSAWVNLTSVDIVAATLGDGHGEFEAFALDDVRVDAVPVPAAVWLFISGLAALGWFRRA